ncbi:MAG: EpsG family protein [Candidatus Bilamarchaeaceae archaeon]
MFKFSKEIKDRLLYHASQGISYLFLLSFVAYVLFVLYVLVTPNGIESVFANFSDLMNTAASIKALGTYGFFERIPTLSSGKAYLFGAFPPLFAFLGSLIDAFIENPIVSTLLLNVAIGIAVIYVLSAHYFKNMDPKAKFIMISFLLINAPMAYFFPFVSRSRQFLAMFIALCMFTFIPKRNPIDILKVVVFSFLLFLSHSHVSFLFILIYFVYLLENSRENAVFMVPIIIGGLLAFPFYYRLGESLFVSPHYLGCSFSAQTFFAAQIPIYLVGVLVVIYLWKTVKLQLNEKIATAIYLIPGVLFVFSLLAASMDLYYVADYFVLLQGEVCSAAYISVALTTLLVPIAGKMKPDQLKNLLVLLMLMEVGSLAYGYVLLHIADVGHAEFEDITTILNSNHITKVGSAVFYKLPSNITYYEFPLWTYTDYAFVKGVNVTFIDNILPVQLSKGKETDAVVLLFHALETDDKNECKINADELRASNTTALIYATTYKSQLTDVNKLSGCGLELLMATEPEEPPVVYVYKLKSN